MTLWGAKKAGWAIGTWGRYALCLCALVSCSPLVNRPEADPNRIPVDGVVVGPEGEERLERLERKELDGPEVVRGQENVPPREPGVEQATKEPEVAEEDLPAIPLETFEEGGQPGDRALGDALARAARKMVGKSRPKAGGVEFRRDCSGLIMAIYTKVGCFAGNMTIGSGGTASLYERCKAEGRMFSTSRDPEPGDLVFFDNTYDRNKNRKCDDWLSHVGMVVSVDKDGTITFVHWGDGGAKEGHMNLKHPGAARSPGGKEWNNEVRPRRKRDRGCVRHLSSELLRGFCRLEKPCGE